jgi:hypothetical protein
MTIKIAMTKYKLLTLGLLASIWVLTPAAEAQDVPQLSGSYSITGFKEPPLNGPYTWCFNFTKTGEVLFPNSGTWTVPSYSEGWNGTWYQVGDEIIFQGVADAMFIFAWKGRLISPTSIGGRQVEFFIDGSTDTAGTFSGTQVSSCPAISGKKGDPAR